MKGLPLPLRRILVVGGVLAVLVLGVVTIRAAAGWAVEAAPLTVAPVSLETVETRPRPRAPVRGASDRPRRWKPRSPRWPERLTPRRGSSTSTGSAAADLQAS
jgi:hypothetical protein